MENERLAEAAAVILGAYLPYLWHDSLPTGTDSERAAAVADLWQALRPLLAHDPAVKGLFTLATDDASGRNLVALRDEIGHQMNLNPALASEIGTLMDGRAFRLMVIEASGHSPPEELEAAAERLRKTITPGSSPLQVPTAGPSIMAPATESVPHCQVCNRQDETLRIVTFPYVVSLLFVTFRRSYFGLWCSRHALQYQLMASAITAGLGWLGFPFGLLYTPVALFKLARGGSQPVLENQRMLFQLARHKQEEGDTAGAIRCLEAALRYGPEPTLERELRALYDLSSGHWKPRRLPQAPLFIGTVLAAGVIGVAIGIVDFIVIWLLSLVIGERVGTFVAILSWVPFVVMRFAAGLLIVQTVSLVASRAPTRSGLLITLYAILLSLTTYYYVLVGSVLASLLAGGSFNASFMRIVQLLAWSVTQGGAWLFRANFAEGIGVVGMLLLMAATVVFAAFGIGSGLRVVGWQRRLEELRGTGPGRARTSSAGWLSIPLLGLAFAGMLALSKVPVVEPSRTSPEAMALAQEGLALLKVGDWSAARASFEEALAADPDSPIPYYGLASVSITTGDCLSGVMYAQQGLERLPPGEAAAGYEVLGGAYRCSDQPEESLAAYDRGLALNPVAPERLYLGRGRTLLYVADYEAAAEAFEQAVAANPDWVTPHAYLATAYHVLGYAHGEAEAIQDARNLPLETTGDMMALGLYYYTCKDLEEAALYVEEVVAQSPTDLDAAMNLGYIRAYLGEYETALAAADRALEVNPAQAVPYLLRSTAYFEQGDLAQARQASEQAVAAEPTNPAAHSQLSYVAYFAGDPATAVEEANQTIEMTPYAATPYQVLALVHLDRGEYQAALESAEQALAINPTDDVSHYVIGKALLAIGQEEQAAAELATFLDLTWDRNYIRDFREEVEVFLNTGGS